MASKDLFSGRHFEKTIILTAVRWYLKYGMSYRDLEELMMERGVKVDHTTIYRWVQRYAPEVEQRTRRYLKPTNDSYRVDETYIKVKGKWRYLYRAVDSKGNTIDFLLTAKRDKEAAKRFFRKIKKNSHSSTPRVINVDKNAAYPGTVEELKQERVLPKKCNLRQCKYLNNIIEQDHRFIKKRVNVMLGFGSFHTAHTTLRGIETMHMIAMGTNIVVVDGGFRGSGAILVLRQMPKVKWPDGDISY